VVANLKGGVGKTTMAVSLAQGLATVGSRVLLIDADHQGSATLFLGYIPNVEIHGDSTFLACVPGAFDGALDSIDPLIRPTYMPGLDVVPACAELSEADFLLPSTQARDRRFQFYAVLARAIEAARDRYDVIVIDTSPSQSYLTTNAIFAADAVLMPVPPLYLDFASATAFFTVFTSLATEVARHSGVIRTYDWLRIVTNRVREGHPIAVEVTEWLRATFGAKVSDVSIPMSTVADVTSALSMGTVYDIDRYQGDRHAFQRMRDAMDALLFEVMGDIRRSWQADAATAAQRGTDEVLAGMTPSDYRAAALGAL
jgi:chromosome partitioning protein